MLLRKPAATFRVGMLCLAASLIIGYFAPRTHLDPENWVDAFRGVLLGASIGLLLLGLRRHGHGPGR